MKSKGAAAALIVGGIVGGLALTGCSVSERLVGDQELPAVCAKVDVALATGLPESGGTHGQFARAHETLVLIRNESSPEVQRVLQPLIEAAAGLSMSRFPNPVSVYEHKAFDEITHNFRERCAEAGVPLTANPVPQ